MSEFIKTQTKAFSHLEELGIDEFLYVKNRFGEISFWIKQISE